MVKEIQNGRFGEGRDEFGGGIHDEFRTGGRL